MHRVIPTILIAAATGWLVWLTFSNISQAYYGFFEGVLVNGQEKQWTQEAVKSEFIAYGATTASEIGRQIYPILILAVSVVWLAVQNFIDLRIFSRNISQQNTK